MIHFLRKISDDNPVGIVAIEPATSLVSVQSRQRGPRDYHYNLPLPWMFVKYSLGEYGLSKYTFGDQLAFAKEFTPGDNTITIESPYIPNVLSFGWDAYDEEYRDFSNICQLIGYCSTEEDETEEQRVVSMLMAFYENAFIFWGDCLFYEHQLTKELAANLPTNKGHRYQEDIPFACAYYSLLESMTQEEINSYSWGPQMIFDIATDRVVEYKSQTV